MLRFVASVMMVSGTLLILDAGITLLWQEPVSAYVANQHQHELKTAFFDPPQRVIRREPLKGDAIARAGQKNRDEGRIVMIQAVLARAPRT